MKKRAEKEMDFEINFFRNVVRKSPNYIDALIPLAEAYTQKGMIHEGLEIDQKLSKLLSDDPIVFYNLACSQSLLGQKKEAIKSLKKALALGYDDMEHLLRDKDLENLYDLSSFQSLIKKESLK
jgi:tetratricopeptide (TPR) repeat protein